MINFYLFHSGRAKLEWQAEDVGRFRKNVKRNLSRVSITCHMFVKCRQHLYDLKNTFVDRR